MFSIVSLEVLFCLTILSGKVERGRRSRAQKSDRDIGEGKILGEWKISDDSMDPCQALSI